MKISAQDSIEKRTTFFKSDYQINYPQAPVNRVSSKVLSQYNLNNSLQLAERYKHEVQDYILQGLTQINRGSLSHDEIINSFHANVTFFRPGSSEWKVQDNCAPYMCFDPGLEMERYDGVNTAMSTLCLEILQQWVDSFQKAVQDGCEIKIFLWLGEATAVVKNVIPEDLRFDFIDTSNISDRVGLIPVLVHFRNRLKRKTGVMRTEIYHWRNAAKTVEEFLHLCLDIPLLMYPTVLGLHLAEELTLGHEQGLEEGTFVGVARLVLRWRISGEADGLESSRDDAVSKVLVELEHPKHPRETHMDCNTKHGMSEALKCETSVRETLRARLKSLIKERNTTALSQNGDGNQTIHEFEDYYSVSIETAPRLLKTGNISLKQDEEDPYSVVITCSKDGHPTFNKRLRFSCGIAINSSKIKISRKRGFIECTFSKDGSTTIGERTLPWKLLKAHDMVSLPDYPHSEFAINQLLMNVNCIYPKRELRNKTEGPPPHQLKWLILHFLKTAPMRFGVPVHIATGVASQDNPLKPEMSQYLLEGVKMFENKVTTFVTWYDLDLGQRLVDEGKINPTEFYEVTMNGNYALGQEHAKHLAEGYKLLKKIMKVNSCRMKQELHHDRRWKIKTFVRCRYPYTDYSSLFRELNGCMDKYVKLGTVWHKVLRGEFEDVSDALKEVYLDEPSVSSTATVSTFTPSTTCVQREKSCDVCGETTGCKRCTGCLQVYYCSRTCQGKDWPRHKSQCKKY